MNENQLTIVKAYEFTKPFFNKVYFVIDNCYRDCHDKNFHAFNFRCIYDFDFRNLVDNEVINLTISDKTLGLDELNKKLTNARQNGFIFNQVNKLTINIYSNQRYINIGYYPNHRIPMMHRQFFGITSRNPEYVE